MPAPLQVDTDLEFERLREMMVRTHCSPAAFASRRAAALPRARYNAAM
jgi:hypothetical protein